MLNFRANNCVLVSVVLVLAAGAGCTYEGEDKARATTQPADAAMRDPFGKWTGVNTDISGGGTTNLNRDALKRDWDDLLLK